MIASIKGKARAMAGIMAAMLMAPPSERLEGCDFALIRTRVSQRDSKVKKSFAHKIMAHSPV
jgi:hypothetical protein